MVKTTGIKASELGSNCWLPARVIDGVRCPRVMKCRYPERKMCKAVNAELAHLHERRRQIIERTQAKISKLIAERG